MSCRQPRCQDRAYRSATLDNEELSLLPQAGNLLAQADGKAVHWTPMASRAGFDIVYSRIRSAVQPDAFTELITRLCADSHIRVGHLRGEIGDAE